METRAKKAHIILAPTMNISRSPFGGRNFENFGEDPFLTGTLTTAIVKGIQDERVGACVKHYVANEQESRRFNIDEQIDERTLREVYLKPFEMTMDADPWMVMTSYNKINGKHADMSKFLMQDVLRSEWKFKGTIISDWGGTNDTVKSVTAGSDLEMPGPAVRRGVHLLAAIKEDNIQVCEVKSCVRRKTLSRANSLGPFPELVVEMIEKAAKVSTSPAELNPIEVRRSYNEKVLESAEKSNDLPEHRILLRETAISGMVLLKNNGILPLRTEKLKKVAVIGPNSKNPTAGGKWKCSSYATLHHYPLRFIRGNIEDSKLVSRGFSCKRHYQSQTAASVEKYQDPRRS